MIGFGECFHRRPTVGVLSQELLTPLFLSRNCPGGECFSHSSFRAGVAPSPRLTARLIPAGTLLRAPALVEYLEDPPCPPRHPHRHYLGAIYLALRYGTLEYIAIAKYTDPHRGALNFEKFLKYPVEHGHIPDDHYVNDVELGKSIGWKLGYVLAQVS